jgi:hypothetical protein
MVNLKEGNLLFNLSTGNPKGKQVTRKRAASMRIRHVVVYSSLPEQTRPILDLTE